MESRSDISSTQFVGERALGVHKCFGYFHFFVRQAGLTNSFQSKWPQQALLHPENLFWGHRGHQKDGPLSLSSVPTQVKTHATPDAHTRPPHCPQLALRLQMGTSNERPCVGRGTPAAIEPVHTRAPSSRARSTLLHSLISSFRRPSDLCADPSVLGQLRPSIWARVPVAGHCPERGGRFLSCSAVRG